MKVMIEVKAMNIEYLELEKRAIGRDNLPERVYVGAMTGDGSSDNMLEKFDGFSMSGLTVSIFT